MVTRIEWVDQDERIFRILLGNHKRKPLELWFKDLFLVGEELEESYCRDYCCFYNKCCIEERDFKTYRILYNYTLSDFCTYLDDIVGIVKKFFEENSIDRRCIYMVPKGYGRDSENRNSK